MKLEEGKRKKKINTTKSYFFENIIKIDKLLAKLTKKKNKKPLVKLAKNELKTEYYF